MRKNQIIVGGKYIARVSGQLVTVQVNEIQIIPPYSIGGCIRTTYFVTNLKTGRKVTFHSATKFRQAAVTAPSVVSGE